MLVIGKHQRMRGCGDVHAVVAGDASGLHCRSEQFDDLGGLGSVEPPHHGAVRNSTWAAPASTKN